MSTKLNGPQQEAVDHLSGPLLIFAGAGSGKTSTLTRRIVRLVESGVQPSRILAVTFTRKAAKEMSERVEKLLGDRAKGLQTGTFHSVCVRILRKYPEVTGRKSDFVIYDEDDQEALIKNILRDEEALAQEASRGWPPDMKPAIVVANIEKCKRTLLTPNDISESDEDQARFRRIWSRYEAQLLGANAFDFADLIVYTMHLAERQDDIGESLRSRWQHVMVDEFQDTDEPQFRLVRALASKTGNLCVVGDDDQCHPPGTMVQTTRSGETKPIEELRDNDVVVGWDRAALRDGRRVRVGHREYEGPMHTVKVAGREVSMTSNHRLVCRWADRRSDACVVYLMWRDGFGFRVGWCQLFNAEGALHLGQRARLEKADRVWILGVFESRTGASVYESIASPRYGLPTITFEPAHGAQHMTAASIGEVFESLSEGTAEGGMLALGNEQRGLLCLADHDLDFDLPFYPLPGKSWENMGRTTLFECYACNLVPGLMMLPVVASHGNTEWTTIEEMDNEWYEGTVHSLEVERDETYAANGIVVHNCIYTWRGAMPEYIRKFREFFPGVKVVKLEQNYRSTSRIVASAASIIERGTDSREPKRMFTANGHGEPVSIVTCDDERDEAQFVAETARRLIDDGCPGGEIVVLYRSHAQSRAIEEELRAADIRYKIHGGHRFFDRAEVRDAMAYLRLLVNPASNVDVLRVINTPARGIGPKTIGRIADLAANKSISLFDALQEAEKWPALGLRERQAIEGFRAMIDSGRAAATELRPSDVVAGIVQESGLMKHWLDEGKRLSDAGKQKQAAEALARSQNLQELISDAVRFEGRAYQRGEMATVDDYVERMTMLADDTEEKDDSATMRLMTIHSSKGLEFDNVFLVGCELGIFPSGRSLPGSEQDHEERRLMYVAVTRARHRLYLTHADARLIYGKMQRNKPSPYFEDIPDDAQQTFRAEDVRRSLQRTA
jgi:DNA helicase-2/ATP-dependent DNA helicase PcrA